MESRSIDDAIVLAAGPNQVFDLLITPSRVRQWWGASCAIIVPRPNGLWVATWGEENHPDYVSAHRITRFDPPRLLELTELLYYARSSSLPFDAQFVVTFTVDTVDEGSRLSVRQEGFPADSAADEYFQGCVAGWSQTLANIQGHLEGA